MARQIAPGVAEINFANSKRFWTAAIAVMAAGVVVDIQWSLPGEPVALVIVVLMAMAWPRTYIAVNPDGSPKTNVGETDE